MCVLKSADLKTSFVADSFERRQKIVIFNPVKGGNDLSIVAELLRALIEEVGAKAHKGSHIFLFWAVRIDVVH